MQRSRIRWVGSLRSATLCLGPLNANVTWRGPSERTGSRTRDVAAVCFRRLPRRRRHPRGAARSVVVASIIAVSLLVIPIRSPMGTSGCCLRTSHERRDGRTKDVAFIWQWIEAESGCTRYGLGHLARGWYVACSAGARGESFRRQQPNHPSGKRGGFTSRLEPANTAAAVI